MSKRHTLGILAYLVPTFALGFVWHLILFKDYYESLAIYRRDIIVPLGFVSMLVQSVLFAWIYERMFAPASPSGASLILVQSRCSGRSMLAVAQRLSAEHVSDCTLMCV
jgi:hypothetical protein